MHLWGDNDVDWKGINDAAYFIGLNLRRWGRVPVTDIKEKFGTVRVYCRFGWYTLHDVTHPGWAYFQTPLWLACIPMRWANKVVIPYHEWLYKFLYGRAVKIWPHLKAEILSGADWPELLKHLGSQDYWEMED